MTDTDNKSRERRLGKAKTTLILEHPFIGTVALNMPFILSDEVPTAATNGKMVIFNPEFVDSLSDDGLVFLVAHECFHPMLEHTTRLNGRDQQLWNMAADYVINQLLTDESIGTMPSMGLLDRGIYEEGGGTSDGIYNLLLSKCDPNKPRPKPGEEGGAFDECLDGSSSGADATQLAAEWAVKVAQAAQSARMMGKLSANMERLVQSILNPKVNWADVLARFMQRAKTDTRSWARMNRRFLPQGIYLPTISGESMGDIVIAVDCSGSISQQVIDQFAAEIRAIKEDMLPSTVHVIYFSHHVTHYESYTVDDDLDIKPHGGGGTAFSPVFRYMQEHDINPVATVFLTDLCCDDFGDEPDHPVLWVSTDKGTAPFGEIVLM